MNKVKFSIIVPVYNVEEYLVQCVDSILCQTFRSFELVLVDDGSVDSSGQICDEYAESDSSVIVVHQENKGLSGARNTGLLQANGEYILFLDSDDYWNSRYVLEELQEFIRINGAADVILFGPRVKLIDDDLIVPSMPTFDKIFYEHGDDCSSLFKASRIECSACLKAVKRSLITDYELKFVIGETSEDYDWTFHILDKCKSISYFGKSFYIYRKRKGSITYTVSQKNFEIYVRQFKRLYSEMCRFCKSANVANLKMFLASMYISGLILSGITKHYDVIFERESKYKSILKYCVRPRDVAIRFVFSILGYKPTAHLLRIARMMKGAVH